MSARKPQSRNETSCRLLPFRVLRAAENMAVDEAVFRLGRREGLPPTLRFFGWAPRCFPRLFPEDIPGNRCRSLPSSRYRHRAPAHGGQGRPARPRADLLAFSGRRSPPVHRRYPRSHRIISSCIEESLQRLGLTPEVAIEGRSAAGTPLEGYCFAAPSRYELLVGGRKTAEAPRSGQADPSSSMARF